MAEDFDLVFESLNLRTHFIDLAFFGAGLFFFIADGLRELFNRFFRLAICFSSSLTSLSTRWSLCAKVLVCGLIGNLG